MILITEMNCRRVKGSFIFNNVILYYLIFADRHHPSFQIFVNTNCHIPWL